MNKFKQIFTLLLLGACYSSALASLQDTINVSNFWLLSPENADSVLGLQQPIKPYSITKGVIEGDTAATIFILDVTDFVLDTVVYENNLPINWLISITPNNQCIYNPINGQNYPEYKYRTLSPYYIRYTFDDQILTGCDFETRLTLQYLYVSDYTLNIPTEGLFRNGYGLPKILKTSFSLCFSNDVCYDPRGYIWSANKMYTIRRDSTYLRNDFKHGMCDIEEDNDIICYPEPNWPALQYNPPNVRGEFVSIAIAPPDTNQNIYLYAAFVDIPWDHTNIRNLFCFNITDPDTVIPVCMVTLPQGSYPRRITLDDNGNVFVIDADLDCIYKFSPQLASSWFVQLTQNNNPVYLDRPMDAVFNNNTLYIVQCPEKLVTVWGFYNGGDQRWPY
jgi:hypothetical protein